MSRFTKLSCKERAHFFGIEIASSIAGDMLRQSERGEALADGRVDDLLQCTFGMTAKLTRVTVV